MTEKNKLSASIIAISLAACTREATDPSGVGLSGSAAGLSNSGAPL
jgi:hypothetical protein